VEGPASSLVSFPQVGLCTPPASEDVARVQPKPLTAANSAALHN
jgi:hypothetical protein